MRLAQPDLDPRTRWRRERRPSIVDPDIVRSRLRCRPAIGRRGADRRSDGRAAHRQAAVVSSRASTRRSSASRTRWSVSSDALRSAARSSSGLRSRTSARSSSALRIASGVRSSWLASSMNRRSASTDAWIRSSRSFIVAPSRVISSSAGGRESRAATDRSTRSLPPRSRIRSTGVEAAPASHHPASDSRSSAMGAPIPERHRRAAATDRLGPGAMSRRSRRLGRQASAPARRTAG